MVAKTVSNSVSGAKRGSVGMAGEIGIGAAVAPLTPCHTTVRTGRTPAVREVTAVTHRPTTKERPSDFEIGIGKAPQRGLWPWQDTQGPSPLPAVFRASRKRDPAVRVEPHGGGEALSTAATLCSPGVSTEPSELRDHQHFRCFHRSQNKLRQPRMYGAQLVYCCLHADALVPVA